MTSNPINSQPASPATQQEKHFTARIRPSYTGNNAVRWQPVFDKMIDSGEDREVMCSTTGYKSRTLYIHANDALLWLMEFSPNKTRYSALRAQITISQYEDRIVLKFKRSLKIIGATQLETVEKKQTWRNDLQEWLENAKDGEIWDTRKLYNEFSILTAEDKTWLVTLLAPLSGVEMNQGEDWIKVMR